MSTLEALHVLKMRLSRYKNAEDGTGRPTEKLERGIMNKVK